MLRAVLMVVLMFALMVVLNLNFYLLSVEYYSATLVHSF
jgi:hypothetical protein